MSSQSFRIDCSTPALRRVRRFCSCRSCAMCLIFFIVGAFYNKLAKDGIHYGDADEALPGAPDDQAHQQQEGGDDDKAQHEVVEDAAEEQSAGDADEEETEHKYA